MVLIDLILKFLLKLNYTISVRLNDFREAHYSSTCARITSLEFFFAFVAILAWVFPGLSTTEDFIFFLGLVYLFVMVSFFLMGGLFLRKIEDLKIRAEHTNMLESGSEAPHFFAALFLLFGFFAVFCFFLIPRLVAVFPELMRANKFELYY